MAKGKPSGKRLDAEQFTAYARILQWFFSFPDGDWTLTEVCENTGTAKKTASPIIEELVGKNIVIKNTFGRSWRLMANRQSSLFVRLKTASNFALILGSTLIDTVRKAYPQAKAIILFGSFRKGEDIRASDIDIAVELPGIERPRNDETFKNVDMGYRASVKVSVLLFSRDNVDINLFSNITNGIVLDGFLEAKP